MPQRSTSSLSGAGNPEIPRYGDIPFTHAKAHKAQSGGGITVITSESTKMNRVRLLSALIPATLLAAVAIPATAAEQMGRPDVATFRAADAGDALGHGAVVIAAADGAGGEWKLPVYEAAVVDELAHHGYDTATNPGAGGQLVQIGVSHDVVVPEEAPHKPVSGAMSTTVSNRGSAFGMALALDFTKPKKAIVATRMDVRIRDRASNKVLWEGHAQVNAREGEDGVDDRMVATRLATALFAKFPEGTEVPVNP
jgi:hypothetical protein